MRFYQHLPFAHAVAMVRFECALFTRCLLFGQLVLALDTRNLRAIK